MLPEYLDYADEKKARKALLTVSTITIAIASVEVLEGSLSFLGLEVFVRQERLVALGQLVCALLLFVFVIRSLPVYLELIRDLSLRRIEREEKRAKQAWEEDWHSPHEPEGGPSDEYDMIEQKVKHERSVVEATYSTVSFVFGALAVLAVDFGVPLALGTVAASNPNLIARAIDGIAERSQSHDASIRDENRNAVSPESQETKNENIPDLVAKP